MTVSDFYAELMKQTFSDSIGVNYTPYVIMLYLKKKRYNLKNDPIDNLCRYVYRFYSDNKSLAIENSNVLITNIEHYYPNDLKQYILEQMNNWMKNGNGVLITDGTFLMINPNFIELTEKDIVMLDKVVDSLSFRNFKKVLNYSSDIDSKICDIDISKCTYETYKKEIEKTKFVKRAFEDINYCACCDESDLKKLQAIHLKFTEGLDDPLNSIVLCNEHAKMYFEGKFRFSKSGKIIIYEENCDLDKRMHLNNKLTKIKNYYLE